MNTLGTVVAYQIRDALRSRWLLQHTTIFLLVSTGLLLAAGNPERALVSLVNVVLLLVPLGALVFGSMHLHGARDFVVLLLTQPVDRKSLFGGLYLGLAVPEALGLGVGLSLPFAFFGGLGRQVLIELGLLIGLAMILTFVFTAIALYISTKAQDRVRCIGIALGLWLVLAVAYDGLVLIAVDSLSRYPLEKPLLGAMLLNPVDLARIVLLLVMDAQALMGYTGAVFARFFGSYWGVLAALTALSAWLWIPFLATRRAFGKQDF